MVVGGRFLFFYFPCGAVAIISVASLPLGSFLSELHFEKFVCNISGSELKMSLRSIFNSSAFLFLAMKIPLEFSYAHVFFPFQINISLRSYLFEKEKRLDKNGGAIFVQNPKDFASFLLVLFFSFQEKKRTRTNEVSECIFYYIIYARSVRARVYGGVYT